MFYPSYEIKGFEGTMQIFNITFNRCFDFN